MTDPDSPRSAISGKDMTFWEHFEELRGVIFRIAIVVCLLAIIAFVIMRPFFEHVVLAPCHADFPTYRLLSFVKGNGDILPALGGDQTDISLMTINLGSQFMLHMSASLWLAATVGLPIIIWLLWRFVSPALYERERKAASRAFGWGMILFYIGVAVGYFVIFPLALKFLSQYRLNGAIAVNLTLDSYMDTFYMILLSMGIVFEIPLLSWMLGKAGILNRRFFRKYRRHAIVLAAALGAIITPTSDIFTLVIVFIPIYGLWELSSFLVPKATEE